MIKIEFLFFFLCHCNRLFRYLPVVSEGRDDCSIWYLKAFLWNRSSDMRVVADEIGAGERANPGLKWSGVELVICIVCADDAQLGGPPLVGGDLHGFSILIETKVDILVLQPYHIYNTQ